MTRVRIPLARPSLDESEVNAVRRVLASGWVVQGREAEAFERAIASLHQARHAVVVSSGTAALHLCYLALDIGPGDAVFIPSFAWPSAANSAVLVGARPIFVDVCPDSYNLDPDDLEKKVGQCLQADLGVPRAVIVVHEFGLATELGRILQLAQQFDMQVVEDAACALGASLGGRPVGTAGCMGVFSFHPRKAVTTGEGGAIVTNDDALADRCRILRNHGQQLSPERRDFVAAGLNYRMTDIQAAIGLAQFEKLPRVLAARKEIARQYLREFSDCAGMTLPASHPEHTWQPFMLVLDAEFDRDAIVAELAEHGIGAGPGSVAAHCGAIYQSRFGYRPEELPISAKLASQGLALPVYEGLEASEVAACATLVRQAIERQRPSGLR